MGWADMGLVRAITTVFSRETPRMLLALVLVTGTLVLLYAGKDVPPVLWTLDGMAITFYFTSQPSQSG